MARQIGAKKWMLARKGVKLYMKDVIGVEVRSITTDHVQKLYIDGEDAALMKDKRILIVDDVISTGESLTALEKLVEKADREREVSSVGKCVRAFQEMCGKCLKRCLKVS